jgi:hypothetical protein
MEFYRFRSTINSEDSLLWCSRGSQDTSIVGVLAQIDWMHHGLEMVHWAWCREPCVKMIDGKELLNQRLDTLRIFTRRRYAFWRTLLSSHIGCWALSNAFFSTVMRFVLHIRRTCQLTVQFCISLLFQKPESGRLTCRMILGNKENSGKVWYFVNVQWRYF